MNKKFTALFIIITILMTIFAGTSAVHTSAATAQFYKIIDFDNVMLADEVYINTGNIRDIDYDELDRFGPDRSGNNLSGKPAYGSGYAIMKTTAPVTEWSSLDIGYFAPDYSHAEPAHTKNMCDFDGVAFKMICEEFTPMMRVTVKIGSTKNSSTWMWSTDVARIHVTGKVVEVAFYFDDFGALDKDKGIPIPVTLDDRSWLANDIKVEISGWSPVSYPYKSGNILVNDVYGFTGDYNPYVKGDLNGDGLINDDDLEIFDKCYENMLAENEQRDNGIPENEIVRPHSYPWGEGYGFNYNTRKAADINGDGVICEQDRAMFFNFVKAGDLNGDGKINGMDLLIMKQHILDVPGKNIKAGSMAFKAADMNNDNKINGMDLLQLKKQILLG